MLLSLSSKEICSAVKKHHGFQPSDVVRVGLWDSEVGLLALSSLKLTFAVKDTSARLLFRFCLFVCVLPIIQFIPFPIEYFFHLSSSSRRSLRSKQMTQLSHSTASLGTRNTKCSYEFLQKYHLSLIHFHLLLRLRIEF